MKNEVNAKISDFYNQRDVKLFAHTRQISHFGDAYFVFVSVFRGKDGKQEPTNKSLKKYAEEISIEGYKIEYILRDENSKEIESGVRATLIGGFPDDVRNVFVSENKDRLMVWVETKLTSPD